MVNSLKTYHFGSVEHHDQILNGSSKGLFRLNDVTGSDIFDKNMRLREGQLLGRDLSATSSQIKKIESILMNVDSYRHNVAFGCYPEYGVMYRSDDFRIAICLSCSTALASDGTTRIGGGVIRDQ